MKKNESISKIMSTELTTVHDAQPVSTLRKIFEENNIHHVPVVSGDDLIGIVTSNDFMRVSFGEFGNQDGKGLDAILDHTYKMHDLMNQNPTTILQERDDSGCCQGTQRTKLSRSASRRWQKTGWNRDIQRPGSIPRRSIIVGVQQGLVEVVKLLARCVCDGTQAKPRVFRI